jgi:hypothetical protein
MNWKWRGGKRSWRNFRRYPGICLEGPRKTTKNLSQDSLSPGRDLNPVPPEYDAGLLTTQPLFSACSLAEVDRRLRGAYCLQHHGDYGGSTYLWNVGLLLYCEIYETTRRYIPEGCHIHNRRRENLKSHWLKPVFESCCFLVWIVTPYSLVGYC